MMGAAAIAIAVALVLWTLVSMRSDSHDLIASNLKRGQLTDLRAIRLAAPTTERALQPMVATVTQWVRRMTPAGSLERLDRKLMLAGRPANWPLERVLATKVALGVVGVVVVSVRTVSRTSPGATLVLIGFAILLYFVPDVLASARASERQREILLALPDALDQMTICMEAGLGFEAAVTRASQANEGPFAQELARTLQEIQVGIGRARAMRGLADRNDVADLKFFVTAVLQADTYGVSITGVLRSQAGELRSKRRQRAEETARKLPLKLLFPLILFIMPPLFVILVGPAALKIIESFSQFD